MGQSQTETSQTEPQSLYDRYPDINNSIGAAARLQLSTIAPGMELNVTLPDNNNVTLNVLSVGRYDPDLLERDEFVDPSMDRAPLPGFVLDASPLDASGSRSFMTIMLDPNDKHTPTSYSNLVAAGVDAKLASEYSERFGGTQISQMILKVEHGGEEPTALTATASDLRSVGMSSAASQIDATNSSRSVTPNVQPAF